jgi:hypothetical protein
MCELGNDVINRVYEAKVEKMGIKKPQPGQRYYFNYLNMLPLPHPGEYSYDFILLLLTYNFETEFRIHHYCFCSNVAVSVLRILVRKLPCIEQVIIYSF